MNQNWKKNNWKKKSIKTKVQHENVTQKYNNISTPWIDIICYLDIRFLLFKPQSNLYLSSFDHLNNILAWQSSWTTNILDVQHQRLIVPWVWAQRNKSSHVHDQLL